MKLPRIRKRRFKDEATGCAISEMTIAGGLDRKHVSHYDISTVGSFTEESSNSLVGDREIAIVRECSDVTIDDPEDDNSDRVDTPTSCIQVEDSIAGSNATELSPDTTACCGSSSSNNSVGPQTAPEQSQPPSSTLPTTTDHDEDAEKQSSQNKRRVHFGMVEIREYPVEMGDNPAAARGIPLTIGWEVIRTKKLLLEDYEHHRPPRRLYLQLKMDSLERVKCLKHIGYSRIEIQKQLRQVNLARERRAGTRARLQLAKLEEALEDVKRAIARITIRRKAQRREQELLKCWLHADDSTKTTATSASYYSDEGTFDNVPSSRKFMANKQSTIRRSSLELADAR